MTKRYRVTGKSQFSAEVADIVLSEGKDRRLVLRPQLVDNQNDPNASVKACLTHHRRHSRSAKWEDVDSFNLAHLNAGQEVRLRIDSESTLKLFEALRDLYEITPGKWNRETSGYVRVVEDDDALILTGEKKQLIAHLLESDGADSLLDYIAKERPDLLLTTADIERQQERRRVAEEFEEHVEEEDWSEAEWQRFFEANKWIFGHNLAFQILTSVTEGQGDVGGNTLHGSGGQRTDMVMSTTARARFTVLVDIKLPQSRLVENRQYRNKSHGLGKHLTGGISQLQSYCRTWVTEGSRREDDAFELFERGIYTYQPKGILVIGDTRYLNTRHKRATFELFRRNTVNPEIITYDELVARAKYSVELEVDDSW